MSYNLTNNKDNSVICSFPRERLLKRSKEFKWYDCVHEYLLFSGKTMQANISVTHIGKQKKSQRNLAIIEKMIDEGKPLTARNKFYYARELFINKRYKEALLYYNHFLETKNGLISNYIDACLDLSTCYQYEKDTKKQLQALVKSFEYDAPRAEICCRIGYYYKDLNKYLLAIKWFRIACTLEKPASVTTSIIHDTWDYIPYMELCACYFKLGNIKKAYYYNQKAGDVKPQSSIYLHNKKYLEKLLHKN